MENTLKLNVFITDLIAYNNGGLKGQWIDLLSGGGFEKLAEVTQEFDEWFISDYESDLFYIAEYASIEELDKMAEVTKNCCLVTSVANVVKNFYGGDIDDVINAIDNVFVLDIDEYSSDHEIAIGQYILDEVYIIDTMPLADYIDCERLGRDAILDGSYSYLDTVSGLHVYSY